MVSAGKRLVLEEVLSEKQIHHVLKKSIGKDVQWTLQASEVRPAMEGLAGFLGDHLKAVLHVDVEGESKKVHLFLKRIPVMNKPKAEFIDENNYYRREMLMYKCLEEIKCDDDPDPWYAKAYIYTDSIIVMSDLTYEGYKPRHFLETLDPEHIFLTTSSIARFHAAFVNYETKKSIDLKRPYSSFKECPDVLTEPLSESSWLKACSKLSSNLLKKFSSKSYSNSPNLESKLEQLYLEACDSLREYNETVNVLLHKDLWVNNIMFRYENDVPINAVLVDFQCLRYGPPAFDLMIFLYLTTDGQFREHREKDVFHHYFSVFSKNLDDSSRRRLEKIGYNKEDFLNWCEKGRMFGMFETIAIYPYILLDPLTAAKTFDDPETYDQLLIDRSEPVLAHAEICRPYKDRNLKVTEEFVERYVFKQV